MRSDRVRVLDGSTFAISDRTGDLRSDSADPLGLFYRDVRHLSKWELRVDGCTLEVLSTRDIGYDETKFFLYVPTESIYVDPTIAIERSRRIGDGMKETLSIHNGQASPVHLRLTIDFAADFADIFEVKDKIEKPAKCTVSSDDDSVELRYRRDDYCRATYIDAPGASASNETIHFDVVIPAHGNWTTEIAIRFESEGRERPMKPTGQSPNMSLSLDSWMDAAPTLHTNHDDLSHTYKQSLMDLAALRFYPDPTEAQMSLPAGGLPWFMALFGRDSLITSFQALPFVPELACTTLRVLAAHQANDFDDFTDAEPGKILHELRQGELVHFGERPQAPYYGSADATALFLILLDEYELWTAHAELARELEPAARAAIAWLHEHGDRDGDGYVEYQTRSPKTGLANQCWKDSPGSIVHPDGSLAKLPRATCEIQGYTYDALCRSARLARVVWNDETLAVELEQRASLLKQRFNHDFWLADQGFYAVALDGDKKPVASPTSNMGHLLWSGIVDEAHTDALVQTLFSDDLFSGWGIRTLASSHASYNPISYHLGAIWPHDTALIALGLARYGYTDEAHRLSLALLDATPSFDYRLPEAFAGFDRSSTGLPIEYPSASSPQAWASGAPLMLIRLLFGLDVRDGELHQSAHGPEWLGTSVLEGIPFRRDVRSARCDL